MSQFHRTYRGLLLDLLYRGHVETNERTGAAISVGDPMSFSIDLGDDRLPLCGIRKTFPKSAAAEVAWFLQGTQDVDFIRQYAPLWDKFVEDDGKTVEAAYGHRWRTRFGRDQLADAISALAANPSDRRIFISAWHPGEDGLGRPGKNVPCPVGFTLSITGGRLNSTLLIRSSDVFVGLPYDVMGHALLMRAIQSSLRKAGVSTVLGTVQVSLAHPHLYEVHRLMAVEALNREPSYDTMQLPQAWTVERITDDPHGYVSEVALLARAVRQPEYMCRPEVVA